MDREEILNHRKQKFLQIGRNKGFRTSEDVSENLVMKEDYFNKIIFIIKKFKLQILGVFVISCIIYFYL
jgi:acetyl-CoA carboxylase carboxyl transferase subunit alpha